MKFICARTIILGAIMMMAMGFALAAQAYDAEFDYNADGAVDDADIALISAAFNSVEGDANFDAAFDHDGDGFISGADINLAMTVAAEE